MEHDPTKRPFSLTDSFVLLTIISACLIPTARGGLEGLPVSITLAILALLIWWGRRNRNEAAFTIGAALLTVMLLALLVPTLSTPVRHTNPTQCQQHVRMLSLACHNYESAHGHFPPPYSVDEYGKPLHSWRVLILPFIEENGLYDKLDLTKPWNDPVNIQYANQMPAMFRCPSYEADKTSPYYDLDLVSTSYVCIVGEETIWNPKKKIGFDDIEDGTANTVLIVESDRHRVHWMSPLDPQFDEVTSLTVEGTTDILSGPHSNRGNFSLADCSTHDSSGLMYTETLRAALTINGGEIIDWENGQPVLFSAEEWSARVTYQNDQ